MLMLGPLQTAGLTYAQHAAPPPRQQLPHLSIVLHVAPKHRSKRRIRNLLFKLNLGLFCLHLGCLILSSHELNEIHPEDEPRAKLTF